MGPLSPVTSTNIMIDRSCKRVNAHARVIRGGLWGNESASDGGAAPGVHPWALGHRERVALPTRRDLSRGRDADDQGACQPGDGHPSTTWCWACSIGRATPLMPMPAVCTAPTSPPPWPPSRSPPDFKKALPTSLTAIPPHLAPPVRWRKQPAGAGEQHNGI